MPTFQITNTLAITISLTFPPKKKLETRKKKKFCYMELVKDDIESFCSWVL